MPARRMIGQAPARPPHVRKGGRTPLERAAPTMIRLDNVTKIYKTDGYRRTILDQASMTLKPG